MLWFWTCSLSFISHIPLTIFWCTTGWNHHVWCFFSLDEGQQLILKKRYSTGKKQMQKNAGHFKKILRTYSSLYELVASKIQASFFKMSSAWIKKMAISWYLFTFYCWIINRCWVARWEGTCHEFYSNRKPKRNICVGPYLKLTCLERDERVPDKSLALRFWSSSENLFFGCVRIHLEIWIIHNQRSHGFFFSH